MLNVFSAMLRAMREIQIVILTEQFHQHKRTLS